MKIDQIAIQLGDLSKISQSQSRISVTSDAKDLSCADYVRIDFEENYSIELREGKAGKTVLVLTAGGIHRVMDLSTLQHLVAMTY